MAILAIKGSSDRSEDIKKLFTDLGASEIYFECCDENYLYYMSHDKKVTCIPDQPDNICRAQLFKVYTIEEFEAKFPYRVGDKVTYDVYYSVEEPCKKVTSSIAHMSWSTSQNEVIYTMKNGTMRGMWQLSMPEPKFEPKDGDVVTYMNGDKATIYVFAGGCKYNTSFYVAYSGLRNEVFKTSKGHLDMNRDDIRPATEEEKKKLFDKLADEGLAWDAERKELVKLKWKPKAGHRIISL